MTATATTARDALEDKVNRVFAGKCVRKDLVRSVKVGAAAPSVVPTQTHQATAMQREALHTSGHGPAQDSDSAFSCCGASHHG